MHNSSFRLSALSLGVLALVSTSTQAAPIDDADAVSTVRTKEAKVEFTADESKKPVLKPKVEKAEAPKAEEAPASEGAAEEAPAPEVADEAPAVGNETEVAADAAAEAPAADDADKA